MNVDEQITAGAPTSPDTGHSRERLQQEYEQLWSEFGASLTRLAASYESNPYSREDLLQEIRLAIWMALPRFRGEASLRTFIFRVAHNRALTHVWRRKRSGMSEESEEITDSRNSPEASAIERVDQSRLLGAIRLLPIPFRQVLTLALEDLSHAEISAVLGISENNVAVRMNRARKLIKERLRGR